MMNNIFPKLHKEGYKFLAISIILTIIVWIFLNFLTMLMLLITIWVYYFFRDPDRISINDNSFLVSPADGLITDISEVNGPEDPGWSSGATAMYIACKVEKPKKCYLIGMDMYSTTDFINNLYKGTYGYLAADESSITPQNWVIQMGRVMVRYQDIQFIKVNPDENNKISERMPQWDSLPNLSYMKKSEFYAKLSLDF